MKAAVGRIAEITSGRPELPAEVALAYRERLKNEFALPEWNPIERPGRPPGTAKEKPGTELQALIENIPVIGALTSGCSACSNLKKEMDRKGCDWCDANFERIVRKIKDNHIVAHLAGEHRIGAYLRQAIDTARTKAKVQHAKRRPRREGTKKRRVRLANSPTIPTEPIPFTGPPRLTLMFHVWPHGNAWRRHLEWLKPEIHRFDRKLLGVAYDSSTASVQDTAREFESICPGWEVHKAKNLPKKRGLREVATYQKMLPVVAEWNTPNDVTFCLHGKGVQNHTQMSETVTWWTEAMYETVYRNIDGVIDAMRQGSALAGSFKRYVGHFKSQHDWHYSGTFYAFRNCIAFNNGLPAYKQIWWGTESRVGDHFPKESAACLFGDDARNLYHMEQQPREQLEQWRVRQ